jgi:hypothetical protein
MTSERSSADPLLQLPPRLDATTSQEASSQLSEALTCANLEREFAKLQPLISDMQAQLASASQSQAAAAASCAQFQSHLLPQLQQRALVMANVFALIDKIEEHVQRTRSNVLEIEQSLQHAEQAQEAPKSFWSSWMSRPLQVRHRLGCLIFV